MLDGKTIIGRESESMRIRACFEARKNVLLEGPVGVGKTHLALSMAQATGRPVVRVDGDGRYTEQKLTGWFDPPSVLQKGYTSDNFIPGPLTLAMRQGAVLFINELNRLPEGVQNVLLPAVDERRIQLPHLSPVEALPGFLVIATQNPKEFVATSHLSEALLDRFELVALGYQPEAEELRIVQSRPGVDETYALWAVRLVRMTRTDERIRRGASIRAAISVAEVAASLGRLGEARESAFVTAALVGLPTRIEIERESSSGSSEELSVEPLIRELADAAMKAAGATVKKKSH
jgi:MoxR-like ATPase